MQLPLLLAGFAAVASASANSVVPSLWDGECFYPTADIGFDLDSYVNGGRWYQVAGTVAPFTAACKCIYAQYALTDEGNVAVNNTCEVAGRAVNIIGEASPANATYGATGVLRVQFPGTPEPECKGPNYIVQGEFVTLDDLGNWAKTYSRVLTSIVMCV